MKRIFAAVILLSMITTGLFAFEGVYGLQTEIIQAIYRGRILGFAEPVGTNKVTLINFLSDTEAELKYGEDVYQVTYVEEGNSLIFENREWPQPLPITLLTVIEDGYRFSYTLVDAKDEVRPAQGSEAFINFTGIMLKMKVEKKEE